MGDSVHPMNLLGVSRCFSPHCQGCSSQQGLRMCGPRWCSITAWRPCLPIPTSHILPIVTHGPRPRALVNTSGLKDGTDSPVFGIVAGPGLPFGLCHCVYAWQWGHIVQHPTNVVSIIPRVHVHNPGGIDTRRIEGYSQRPMAHHTVHH